MGRARSKRGRHSHTAEIALNSDPIDKRAVACRVVAGLAPTDLLSHSVVGHTGQCSSTIGTVMLLDQVHHGQNGAAAAFLLPTAASLTAVLNGAASRWHCAPARPIRLAPHHVTKRVWIAMGNGGIVGQAGDLEKWHATLYMDLWTEPPATSELIGK
jgi:hypothetical protein